MTAGEALHKFWPMFVAAMIVAATFGGELMKLARTSDDVRFMQASDYVKAVEFEQFKSRTRIRIDKLEGQYNDVIASLSRLDERSEQTLKGVDELRAGMTVIMNKTGSEGRTLEDILKP